MGDSREDAVKGAIGYPYSLHFHTKYGAKELVTVSQPHDGLMNIGMWTSNTRDATAKFQMWHTSGEGYK